MKGQGKTNQTMGDIADLLKSGEDVMIGPAPQIKEIILMVLKRLGCENIKATPAYRGQGAKIGEMIKPEDDTPIGWILKLDQ